MRRVAERMPSDVHDCLSVGKVDDKGAIAHDREDSARPNAAAIRFRHPHLGVGRKARSTLASGVRAFVE